MKTFKELKELPTYEERFRYLVKNQKVGEDTFGPYRYLCQKFYKSPEWKNVTRLVKMRDECNDLGIKGRPISGKVYVHHIEPITPDDIIHRREKCLDPNTLICCDFMTHEAIHYSDERLLYTDPVERTPNDTSPWRLKDG